MAQGRVANEMTLGSDWMIVMVRILGFLLLGWLGWGAVAHAETRVALLVGHQNGWKGEPRLDYVLSGDVRPLARKLSDLGFQVLQLENSDAKDVRQVLQRVSKQLRSIQGTKTFLFYYSGHADPSHFHLGPKGKNPLSYKEFSSFFSSLPADRKIAIFDSCYSGEIIRRFGSLKRFQSMLKRGKAKGIRARRKLALHRLLLPKQGFEQGMRVIASSLDISWELRERKASVFTYHLLSGLKGPADLNHDGRITVDELFDYTSQKVLNETGQRPQQFVLVKRSTPYMFAPVYRSQLRIGSEVIGKIKVAVANFVWTQKKQEHRPMRLAVVDGKGTVSLEHKGRCFRQSLWFPKGGEAKLRTQWNKIPCRQVARRRKGLIVLQAQPYAPRRRTRTTLAVFGGYTQTLAPFVENMNWGGGLQLRWGRHWGGSVQVVAGIPQDKGFWLSSVWLRPEAGWTWELGRSPLRLDVFLGVYLQAGLVFQHNGLTPTGVVFGGGGGGILDISWWFSRIVGLRLGARAGFSLIPIRERPPFAFEWQAQVSAVFAF
ncbi:MAG: caspase family protein [Deltaproteobacteria bacterium]|nr:MAG: caspase family protein [Deltaproteobacteria bacterium]